MIYLQAKLFYALIVALIHKMNVFSIIADFTLRFVSTTQNRSLHENQEESELQFKTSKISSPTQKLDESYKEFCVNGRLVPSFFAIGVQKCGTTTLDGILSKFPELSHGTVKEHHFFDGIRKNGENKTLHFKKYIHEFPLCNGSMKIRQTYDASTHYTFYNHYNKAIENIKLFYNKFKIPLNRLRFIAIVCPNSRRIPSNFYFYRSRGFLKSPTRKFNEWFDWMLKHQDHNNFDGDNPLRKGFYDEIFGDYLKAFPDSEFLFIDNEFAFKEMQNLSDFLAIEFNIKKQHIPSIHEMVGTPKEEALTDFNKKRLNLFYSKHEKQFLEITKLKSNVRTWPEDNFLDKWK